ncbi:hypothetical protein [Alkalibaculum bacchi]|uniref:hypothetical protein n=1 Tax=Alkalibaculum bacchi TaxID=645887 RepID=UPI0026EB4F64|nr:hypothetical protein [Alkalibaculum bacchi]
MNKSVSISKQILIFLCIVLLFSMTSCQKEMSYFEDIHIGMSRNEIMERNKDLKDPQISEEDYIVYKDIKYNSLSGETSYTFDRDGELIHSSIIFIAKEKESPQIYNKLVKDLSIEYGESTTLYENTTMWKIEDHEKEGYILCLLDRINDNISLIMCTPEIYDWIVTFKSVSSQRIE